jgi:hypothetical protein
MVRSTRVFVVAAMGLIAWAVPAPAATAIGKVVAAAGSPTSSGRALRPGSAVYENDRIVTRGGNVQILFVDSTKLVVGPNSTLVIDRFLMRGGNRAQKFSVDALRGTFRFISGNSARNAYDIQTANATIGIRGTGFDFSAGRQTLVAVMDGRVRLCARGRCESLNEEGCSVGRAGGGGVDELEGRAKGRALRQLPYIVNQSSLNRSFRLNTRACRAAMALQIDIPANRDQNQQRTGPAGPPGGEPPGAPGGPGGPSNPPGGGTPGGGPGHGGE